MTIYKKIQKAFSSSSPYIYLRTDTINTIKSFLESQRNILHITGNPGVGKTSIIKNILKKNYLYLNTYIDKCIKQKIIKSKYDIIVIDEYDKLKKDKNFIIFYIKENNKKLITLSNNLILSNYIIQPYTSKEIEEIIKSKIKIEIKYEIMSSEMIKFVSKKFSDNGDLRAVFNFILNNFNVSNNKVEIIQNVKVENNNSWHHNEIKKLKNNNRRKAYLLYLKVCEDNGVNSLLNNEFNIIYELYSNN